MLARDSRKVSVARGRVGVRGKQRKHSGWQAAERSRRADSRGCVQATGTTGRLWHGLHRLSDMPCQHRTVVSHLLKGWGCRGVSGGCRGVWRKSFKYANVTHEFKAVHREPALKPH